MQSCQEKDVCLNISLMINIPLSLHGNNNDDVSVIFFDWSIEFDIM